MKVTQISVGRFHHFHLARQMERLGLLENIYTGYPSFKLKDEQGIDKEKIKTFPWLHTPYMKRGKLGLDKLEWLNKEWEWLVKQSLDKFVASKINHPTILISLSGFGLDSGKAAKKEGGFHICDRGSSHIRFQDKILREEYANWGFKFNGVDPRVIDKEEAEYDQADKITIPSEFVRKSFIEMGVPAHKLKKIVYGARLDRFKKSAEPSSNVFRVLWVGNVSIRKGFMYALEAFQKLNFSSKEFMVIGAVEPEIKELIRNHNLTGVTFAGVIDNSELPVAYSQAHVFLIASLEEGLAMVQGEALACGCPVIATTNTGAEDLITDGKEGFIVPIRSSQAITDRLQQLADEPALRQSMSEAAIQKVKSIGGWDSYGTDFSQLFKEITFNN